MSIDERDRSFRAPLSNKELGMLQALSDKFGMTAANYFRRLLREQYLAEFGDLEPPRASRKVLKGRDNSEFLARAALREKSQRGYAPHDAAEAKEYNALEDASDAEEEAKKAKVTK